ncbi:MAG: endonuclease NucS [Planctomycetota bacterium]|nr:endonuclease NucS [Planctomycetota bacterium]
MEDDFPGLWHRLYRHQCVAVGWPPQHHKIQKKTNDRGLARVRNSLSRMAIGDYVVAALKGNRVGRLGQITSLAVNDDEWDPLVPESKDLPYGQMGRRVNVRWDLACGPTDRDLIVLLPEGSRFTSSELLPTISEIKSQTVSQLQSAMNDPTNWVGLLAHFKYERALSDYIAAYPHHLEDGLVPHPDSKIREKVFSDRKRLDVLLLDREERPVIVECKQGSPTLNDLKQLRHYMRSLKKETGRNDVRGILVHGGSRNLHQKIAKAAALAPPVEIVQYRLQVEFAG